MKLRSRPVASHKQRQLCLSDRLSFLDLPHRFVQILPRQAKELVVRLCILEPRTGLPRKGERAHPDVERRQEVAIGKGSLRLAQLLLGRRLLDGPPLPSRALQRLQDSVLGNRERLNLNETVARVLFGRGQDRDHSLAHRG